MPSSHHTLLFSSATISLGKAWGSQQRQEEADDGKQLSVLLGGAVLWLAQDGVCALSSPLAALRPFTQASS